MDRREFNGLLAGAAASAVFVFPRLGLARQSQSTRVNGQRLNDHLARLGQFGKNPQGGVSRLAYSDADRAARAQVMEWMGAAALDPSIDYAGNLIGRRAGQNALLKPIMFGSHIDSVPEGGNYDGDVGSMAAIEVAQTLAEHGLATQHPVEVVIWSDEEGILCGSRAVSGQLPPHELQNISLSGKTVADGIRSMGGDPTRLDEVKRARGDLAGYFELHIEQGGILDAAKIDIGIVEGIVGIGEWEVTITGFANHAWTTPMNQRQDAMLTAARFVDMVHRVVRSFTGAQVGNVGRIQVSPGAPNVIPGVVVCSLELRDLDLDRIKAMHTRIADEAQKIGQVNGTTIAIRELTLDMPALSDLRMRGFVSDAAKALGLSTRTMPSGAGHDAQAIATLGPMGMIFVPSVGGISHSPKEFSRPEDITNGANVLLGSVMTADRALE